MSSFYSGQVLAQDRDVVVVGAGLAGAFAAACLGRLGVRTSLVEMFDQPLNEFRVEKVAGEQAATMRRLGFLDAVAARATLVPEVMNIVGGRLLDRTVAPHYSILYPDLVRSARDLIPPGIERIAARAEVIEIGPERQTVRLSDGRAVSARLVVLATGHADRLREGLGFRVTSLLPDRTLSFGFDLAPVGRDRFTVDGLTCYGARPEGRLDYLAMLRLGDVLRANLFTFHDLKDPWVAAFRRDPLPALSAALPGLLDVLGPVRLAAKIQMFAMPVLRVANPLAPGLVLLGDAYQTSCPAAGTGVLRLLSDVEALCRHLPGWLASPGMSEGKMAAFYADQPKRAADERSLRQARYRRGFALQPSLAWKLRRRASIARRRMRSLIQGRPAAANGSAARAMDRQS